MDSKTILLTMSLLRKHKKTFSLIIIASAVTASFIIVSGGQEKKPDYLFEVVKNTPDASATDIENPLPDLTAEFTVESLKTLMSEKNNILAQETKNATLAKTLPDKDAVEKIVGDIIDKELTSETIDPATISVTKDNSKQMQVVYLLAIQEIIKDISEKNNAEDVTTVPIATYFGNVGNNFKNTTDILMAMNVPPSWVDIHADLIGYFTSQKNVYLSLSKADQDPLRFMIAIQRIADESEKKFDDIRIKIDARVREQKII